MLYITRQSRNRSGAKERATSKSQPQTPASYRPSLPRTPRFFPGHGDHRRGAAPRPARQRQRPGLRRVGGAEEASVVVVRGGGGQERGLRDRRPRRRTGLQGAGGGLAAGGRVQEEHVPVGNVHVHIHGRQGQGRRRSGSREETRGRRWAVRQGEHGRRAVPAQGGPADVRRVRRAQGRARQALRLLLLAGRLRRPVRRGLRGQGRGPHARRRRAVGHVHQLLQEAEDHEGLRSAMKRIHGAMASIHTSSSDLNMDDGIWPWLRTREIDTSTRAHEFFYPRARWPWVSAWEHARTSSVPCKGTLGTSYEARRD